MAGYRRPYRPSEARQQKGQTAPQEPDLVPIMNLFLTIIPFLMLMITVSVSLMALNFASDAGGGAGGSGGGGGNQDKILEIHLMLRQSESLELFPGMEIREPGSTIHKLPWLSENVYDFNSLNDLLARLKEKYSETTEIAVVVHPDVLYDTLIRTIDLCKTNGFVTVHYRSPQALYAY